MATRIWADDFLAKHGLDVARVIVGVSLRSIPQERECRGSEEGNYLEL